MPKIVEYEGPQVSTQLVSKPQAQMAPAAAFGGPLAQGVSNLAEAGLQLKQRVDTTSAEEALVQFEREKNDIFFNPDSGYFNKQGKDAYDSSADAAKALEDLKRKYGESLSQQARVMFDRAADQHITRSQIDISRHASKGLQAWEISTLEAQVENSVENASLYWNDPERLRVQNVIGRQAIIDSSEMAGISPEATAEKVQTFESSFARASISAATQSSSAAGRDALERYGDRLEGPDKQKLEGVIAAKEKAEKTQADARIAVLKATNLVDQYDSRSDIIEQVNQIEDPELRKKTMTEAISQFNQKKQAKSEDRTNAFESAESHVINGGTAEGFKAQYPDEWEKLSPKQQRSIEEGKAVITDWDTFSNLMLLPREKLAKVDPSEYVHQLAEPERRALIGAIRSANGVGSTAEKVDHQIGRTRTAQTTDAIEQLLGKKSKWNDDKREKANTFYSVLDDEVKFRESQVGHKLTSEEFTNVLSDLTRKVTLQKDWWFDQKLDLGDIPPDDVKVLTEYLRNNEIPITSDNLIKAYKQASE